jgi:hypothetical protein
MHHPPYELDTGNVSDWRETPRVRGSGWHLDIGFELQDVLRSHDYDYQNKGSKPDDPGWHVCKCGTWEGYWSGFHPHVADHLRAVIVARDLPTKPASC